MSIIPTAKLSSLAVDADQLRQEWTRLAAEITLFDSDAAQRFQDVAQSLDTPAEDRWLEVGLAQQLNLDGIEQQAKKHYQDRIRFLRWLDLRWLELARNVLILTPIFFTWLGLFLAATNYQAAVEARPELARDSFLLLWQQNFLNLGTMPSLSFSHIALGDFLLLFVIILLTLFIHHQHDVKEVEALERALDLRRRIAGLLWSTNVWLADKRLQRQQSKQLQWDQRLAVFDRFNPIAQDALDVLTAEQQRIVNLATSYQQEFEHLRQMAQDMAQAATGLPGVVRHLREGDKQLKSSLTHVSDSLQKLITQQEQLQIALASLSDEIRQSGLALTDAANQTAQAASQANDLARQLKKGQDALQESLEKTATNLERGTQNLSSALDSLNKLSGRLDDLVPVNQQLADSIAQLIQQQQPILNMVDRAITETQAAYQQLYAQLQQVVDSSASLQQDVRTLVRYLPNLLVEALLKAQPPQKSQGLFGRK